MCTEDAGGKQWEGLQRMTCVLEQCFPREDRVAALGSGDQDLSHGNHGRKCTVVILYKIYYLENEVIIFLRETRDCK